MKFNMVNADIMSVLGIFLILLLTSGCSSGPSWEEREAAELAAMSPQERLNHDAEQLFTKYKFNEYTAFLNRGAKPYCGGFIKHPKQVAIMKATCSEEKFKWAVDIALYDLFADDFRSKQRYYTQEDWKIEMDTINSLLSADANPNHVGELYSKRRTTFGIIKCSDIENQASILCAVATAGRIPMEYNYEKVKVLLLAGANPNIQTSILAESGMFNAVDILNAQVKYSKDTVSSSERQTYNNHVERVYKLLAQFGGKGQRPEETDWFDVVAKTAVSATIGALVIDSGIDSSHSADILTASYKDIWNSGEGNALSSLYSNYLKGDFSINDPTLKKIIDAREEFDRNVANYKQQSSALAAKPKVSTSNQNSDNNKKVKSFFVTQQNGSKAELTRDIDPSYFGLYDEAMNRRMAQIREVYKLNADGTGYHWKTYNDKWEQHFKQGIVVWGLIVERGNVYTEPKSRYFDGTTYQSKAMILAFQTEDGKWHSSTMQDLGPIVTINFGYKYK